MNDKQISRGVLILHGHKCWASVSGVRVGLAALGTPGVDRSGGTPLSIGGQPLLLFFNNGEWCQCILPLHAREDEVIAAWQPDLLSQVDIRHVIQDERPDLQRQYDVRQAPMLLLLDAGGQLIWREWGVASNPDVFEQ